MSGINTMIDTFNQDTIAVYKNLIEIHEILKLDGWQQDVARIKATIANLETKLNLQAALERMKNESTNNQGKA